MAQKARITKHAEARMCCSMQACRCGKLQGALVFVRNYTMHQREDKVPRRARITADLDVKSNVFLDKP
jgi:hypothetical protein